MHVDSHSSELPARSKAWVLYLVDADRQLYVELLGNGYEDSFVLQQHLEE